MSAHHFNHRTAGIARENSSPITIDYRGIHPPKNSNVIQKSDDDWPDKDDTFFVRTKRFLCPVLELLNLPLRGKITIDITIFGCETKVFESENVSCLYSKRVHEIRGVEYWSWIRKYLEIFKWIAKLYRLC